MCRVSHRQSRSVACSVRCQMKSEKKNIFSVPPKSINRGAAPGYSQSASSRATINIQVAQQPGPARQLACLAVGFQRPMLALLAYDNPPSLAIPVVRTSGSLGNLGSLSRLLIMLPPLKTWCSLPCVEASGFETIRLATATLWLWIGALIVRYTLDAVCGTNPFDDPIGAYGENPE